MIPVAGRNPPPPAEGRVCARCGAPRPPTRRGRSYRYCSRECTLLAVGLPADFNPQHDAGGLFGDLRAHAHQFAGVTPSEARLASITEIWAAVRTPALETQARSVLDAVLEAARR